MPRKIDLDALERGLRAGQRAALARAITLVESKRADHAALAQTLLERILPDTGRAMRIGITGVPGVGKSTFIESFGSRLTGMGKKVAVLAVDPTSTVSGGSILGDKTRMTELSRDDAAFIRPSPTAGTLGGVARRTRETLLLCEAAGYDVVLVETVGVGQSETMVAGLVDAFLVLMLPGAGDELQGIKRGLLEIADILVVNKADGDRKLPADVAARRYRAALSLMTPVVPGWRCPVKTMSGLHGDGIGDVWDTLLAHRRVLRESGHLAEKRRTQRLTWMQRSIDERLRAAFAAHPEVRAQMARTEQAVLDGTLPPTAAATALLAAFGLD